MDKRAPLLSSRLPLLEDIPASARIVDLRSGRELDANALRARARREAAMLAALGLAPGAPVVVAHARAFDTLPVLFAAWAAGHPAIVCSAALTAEERRNVIAHTHAAAWLGEGKTETPPSQRGSDGSTAGSPLGPDGPALILMTSGTTGTPKGVTHNLRSLEARLALNAEHIGAVDLARSLCLLPVHFGHGLIGNCLTPLVAGGTLHLLDSPEVAEIRALGATMDRLGITFLSSVPSFWKIAMRLSPPPKRPPRRLHVGSEPLSLAQAQAVAGWSGTMSLCNMYGMTEAANWIAGAALGEAEGRDGHVGRPWGGAFAVLQEDGRVAAEGRGEVLIRSPSAMLGYFNDPAGTAAAFLDGWLRSGDLGALEKGALTLIGRLKSEINRGGIKIQPEEIEMLLERHPTIAGAGAFGVEDAVSGEAVAAAIVAAGSGTLDLEAIRAWCRERIRPEAVPAHLYAVDALPRNDRGKLDRLALRRSFGCGKASS